MLTIGVHYLMGWSMAAADGAKKQQAEWPPHPERLFMALTAACFQADDVPRTEAEQALQWLEHQGAPSLYCSLAKPRKTVTSYVPVNDVQMPRLRENGTPSKEQLKSGLSLLPEKRSRQPRHFPVAIPDDPRVYFIWTDSQPLEWENALVHLCRNVTSLGHSASLVQVWLCQNPPGGSLVPSDDRRDYSLRVPWPGRLDALKRFYNEAAIDEYHGLKAEHESATRNDRRRLKEQINNEFPAGEPKRLRPERGRAQGYARIKDSGAAREILGSLFDPRLIIIKRISGRPLGLESTLLLTKTLRDTLLKNCKPPIPEWISGHSRQGAPSRQPHIAMFPLPHVGREHADGHLLGVAIALPRTAPQDALHHYFGWLTQFDDAGHQQPLRLYHGRLFDWQVQLELADFPPFALRADTWNRPATCWASVTPVVFDRHPKGKDKDKQIAGMLTLACERISLPRPAHVLATGISPIIGVPPQHVYPPMQRKQGGGTMRHSHVVLEFSQPVQGPILLGAGRFRGYGLLRPMREERS